MCLGIPMQIVHYDGVMAQCCTRGVERRVSLFLLQHEDIVVGDYVMVHRGEALQKLTAAEAADVWASYDEILTMSEPATSGETTTT